MATIKTTGSTDIETTTVLDNNSEITVQIGKDFSYFSPNLQQIKENAKFPVRGKETAMINEQTGSSVAIRQHGQINLTASKWAALKLNPNGKLASYGLERRIITNRLKISTDDIVFNEHKLNPYLIELTDVKKVAMPQNTDMLIGNFCMYGSVLTKSWEVNLKRYVMIRRPARFPMFSSALNVPEIHEGLGITDPLKIDEDLLAKSDKGFQVNKVYLDENSLIGKEGVDREGINRNANIEVNVDSSGYVSGTPTNSTEQVATNNASISNASVGGYDPSTNTYNFGIEANVNKLLTSQHSWDSEVFNMPTIPIAYSGKDRWIRIAYTVSALLTKPYKTYSAVDLPPIFVFAQIWSEMGPLGENGICGGFSSIDQLKSSGNKAYWYGMVNRNFSGLHTAASGASYASDVDYCKDYAYSFLIRRADVIKYANENTVDQYAQAMKASGYFEADASEYAQRMKTGIRVFKERLAKTSS